MIISDKHRLVFIHIPKCAGTFIRKALQPFDSRKGMFTSRVAHHPELGPLDYVHIPLFTLHEHFRTEFEAARDYWSFAVMRDPFARFASSVSQHTRRYSDQPMQKRSLDEIRAVIDQSIDYLSSQPRDLHLLPPEYIHFQKQVDYIQLDGKRILDRLYSVDEVDMLLTDAGQNLEHNLVETSTKGGVIQANRTIVFRNDLIRRAIETARPITDRLGKVLPESVKQRIRDQVYVPRDLRMKAPFEANHVRQFISDYYADDIALYQQVIHSEQRKVS